MEKVIGKEEFEKKGKNLVFRSGAKRVLVLEVNNKIFALDNRCPHEGYPLSKGTFDEKSCVLTCNWHNWKFDLTTGKCLLGGDNVRTYPVSISDNEIRIDLDDPSLEVVQNTIINGFRVAFVNRGYGRISREIARLVFHNIDPLCALNKAILWSYEKLEFGTTHAYAAAADWTSLYSGHTEREDQIICLTEAIDHIALDSLRRNNYKFHQSLERYSEEELFLAIENEDAKRAEALTLSALKAGLRFCDFNKVLSKAALNHYSDFGHSLIYVIKSGELSNFFNDVEIDKALTLSLVRSLSYTTREDTLPQFKKYKETVKTLESSSFGQAPFCNQVLDKMDISQSYDWLKENQARYSAASLYETLLCANAVNFLQYDLKYQEATQNPVSKNIDWLDFTHAITFSNAVRETCEKYPELWARAYASK